MPRPLAAIAVLVLLGACAPSAPESCEQMCGAAQALYQDCLETWGTDWQAAGYDDAEDFGASCEAWGFELALLAQDSPVDDAAEQLEATCEERRQALREGTCDTYTDIDWNELPWESGPTAD